MLPSRGQGLRRALQLTCGLRRAILAACAVGAAVGWWYDSTPLIGLCLVIAGEEALETTVVIAALRDGLRRESHPSPPAPRSTTRFRAVGAPTIGWLR